ncbi:MAG: formylglycine-generating enzyme family protein [Armatimonadota bacterium]|nr:formylglycine-generating enzyme family protein [Armatimonadota bacterium]
MMRFQIGLLCMLLCSPAFSQAGPPSLPGENASAHVVTKINAQDGATMILIPAGPFLMGDTDQSDNPRRTVTLDAYYIYKNLVTVAQYRKFCNATDHYFPDPPPWGWKNDHPIVNVGWDDATAYCEWAGTQLPTEAQWEKAARGTDGRKFPWGNDFKSSRLWCSKAAYADAHTTAPVGSFPAGASPYGVLDLAGNVWEWCADWYSDNYIQTAPLQNPIGPELGTHRVLRGGSWYNSGESDFHSAFRNWGDPTYWYNISGFRCVIPVDSPAAHATP